MPGPASPPDVIEAGRVMATLDDWRTIMFVALVLIALMFFGWLTTVVLSLRAWSKSIEGLHAVRQALLSINIIVARVESELTRRRDD